MLIIVVQDAGQRTVDHSRCGTCGMLFAANSAADLSAHVRFHGRYVAALLFPKKVFSVCLSHSFFRLLF